MRVPTSWRCPPPSPPRSEPRPPSPAAPPAPAALAMAPRLPLMLVCSAMFWPIEISPRSVDAPSAPDEELSVALASLPDQQRAVVVLRFLADLSVAQTADVLRVPVGTVKSTTSRALSALRSALEEGVSR